MNFLDKIIDEKTAFSWIDQNSEEWDRVRIGRFTSSELYRLMDPAKVEMSAEELKARPKSGAGSSVKLKYDHSALSDKAYTYINEKVAEVLTGFQRDNGYAFPMVWGKDKEPEAIEYFTEKFKHEYERVGFFPFTDHAGGSPDGFINNNAIAEVKCPFDSAKHLEYLMFIDQWDIKRNFPSAYWQMQGNMLFTDRDLCYFISFDPRMKEDKHKMKVIEVKPIADDRMLIINKIEAAVKEKLSILQSLNK